MSVHITSPVLKLFRGRTPLEKLVLVILSDYAGEEGDRIFPSIGTVAARAGCSGEHCRKVVKGLVERGVLEVVRQGQGGDPRDTTEYRIVIEKLEESHPMDPAPGSAAPGSHAPGSAAPGSAAPGSAAPGSHATPRAQNGGPPAPGTGVLDWTPRAGNGGSGGVPPAPTTGDPPRPEPKPPAPSTDNPSGTTSEPPPRTPHGEVVVVDGEGGSKDTLADKQPVAPEDSTSGGGDFRGRNAAYAEVYEALRRSAWLATMNEQVRRSIAAAPGVTVPGVVVVIDEWARERRDGKRLGKGALISRLQAYAEGAQAAQELEERARAARMAEAERIAAEGRERDEREQRISTLRGWIHEFRFERQDDGAQSDREVLVEWLAAETARLAASAATTEFWRPRFEKWRRKGLREKVEESAARMVREGADAAAFDVEAMLAEVWDHESVVGVMLGVGEAHQAELAAGLPGVGR